MPIDAKSDVQLFGQASASRIDHTRPGEPLPTWQLYEQRMHQTSDGLQALGVRTPEGKYYPFIDDEQMVFVRVGNDRKPFIRLKDGGQITFSAWEKVRQQDNQKIFESVDPKYARLYQHLLTDSPDLAQLGIEIGTSTEYPELEYTGGFWKRPDAVNPNPRIIVEASGIKHYEKLLILREISARAAAEMLEVDFSLLQQHPEVLSMFVFLHEVGHADDFIKNYLNNSEITNAVAKNVQTRKTEMRGLPIPGVNPVDAKKMAARGELDLFYQKYRIFYEAKGILSLDTLLQANEEAYRNLPSESYADRFASESLRRHWNDLGFGEFGTPKK